MAKDKIDVKSLAENLQKRWGFGTKMPGGENAEKERSEDQLVYTQMIMGSLAAMIWGEKSVTKDDKVKTLLGHKDNIYDLIESIKKNIDEAINNGEVSINLTNNTIDNLDKLLTKNIKDPILEMQNKLNENLGKAFQSIVSNQDNIEKLYENLNKLVNSANTKSNNKNNDNKNVELIIKSDNLNIKEVSINLTNNTIDNLGKLLVKNIKDPILEIQNKLNENLSDAFQSIVNNQNNIKDLYKVLNNLVNSDNTKSNNKNNDNKNVELIIKSDNLNIKEVFESLKGVIKELGEFTLLNSEIGSGFDSYLSLINSNADKFDIFGSKLKENIECLEKFFTVLKTYKENSGDVIYLDIKHKSLSDTINKLKDEISVVFNKELIETIINNINDNFKNNPIEINIDTELANKIKEFIESLTIDPEKLNQTQLAVDSLGNILESLNSSLSSNAKKINSNLTALNGVFGNISVGFTKLSTINIDPEKLKQTQLAIESLENVLDSLNSSLSFDTQKINKNLTDLNGLFTDTSNGPISGNFGKLFINISNILDDKNIKAVSKDITSLNSVLQTIISVISLDKSSIDLYGLRTLLRITNDKTGIIYKLLDNLSKLTSGENAASINNKNFIAIKDFFDAMSEIGNIGLYKRALIKYNIRYFINFIGREIPNLLDELSKSSKKTISNETVKSIAAIQNIFESLSKIGELEFNHKIRMKLNLMFIRHFILNDIANVLNEIIKSIDSESEKSSAVIESFIHLLDKIFEIGNISFTKFIKLSLKLDLLETILESQVIGEGGILNLISNINNIQKASDNLSELGSIFDIFNNLVDSSLPLKDIILFSFKVATIESFISITKRIIENLSNITIGNDILQKLDEVKDLFDKTKTITELISSTKISTKNALLLWLITKIEQQIINDVSQLITVLNGIQYDENKVKNIIDLIKSLSEIKSNITSALLYKKTLNIISGSVDLIKDICKKIKDNIKQKDIENAKNVLGSFNDFIFKAAGILLMGSIIIGMISWENLLAFTAALSGFLFVLSKTFNDISVSLKKDIKTADEIIKLIAASGLILLLGSAIMNDIEILDLILFTAALSGFLFVLSKTLENISKSLKKDIKTANEIIKLIAASGLILLFGSAITKLIEPQNLIIFTACLGGFLGGITYIVNKLNKDINESVKTLREAMIIVGMGAAILIVGSLAATQFKYENVISFVLGLGAILGGIYLIFKYYNAETLNATYDSIQKALLIVGSAALILIAGSLAATQFKYENVISFVLGLGAILGGITYIVNKFNKDINESAKTLRDAMIIVGMSATILIVGSLAATQFNYENIISFILGLGAILGGITYIVNKFNKDINESTKTLRDAMIIVGMSATILIAVSLAASQFKYENIISFIFGLGAILGGIYLIFKYYDSETLNVTYDSIKKAMLIVGGAALILIAGSLAASQFKYENILSFVFGLGAILGGIYLIFKFYDAETLNVTYNSIKKAMLIVGGATLILMGASLAASQFKYENIISFILGLGAILGGIYLIFKFYDAETLNVTYNSIKKALLIVGGAALILMGASLAASQFKYENIISFVFGLGAILGGIYLIFKFYDAETLNVTYDSIKKAMLIVGGATLILIAGSLAASQFKYENIISFVFGLGAILGGIYLIFKFYNGKTLNTTYDSIKKALLIVGGAALILIAGSLASKYYSFADAMGFVIELGSFLIALGVLFWSVGKMFNGGIKKARTLVNVVIASSLIMIMGQLLYDYLDTFKIFGFVLILSGFTIALATVFWVAGNLMKKAFIGIALMVLVTAAAGTILLLAGKIVSDNPDILKNALYFAGLLAVYVAVMGLVCGLLGKFAPTIGMGILVMGGIMLVTLLAIGVMYIMHKVASQPNFYDTIIDGLKAMGWVFGSFIAVIVALGVAVTGPQAVLLAAGAAALAVLEGLVWAAAKVLSAIAISVKQLQSVNVSKEGFKQMKDIIINFASLVVTLIDEFPSNPLKLAKLGIIVSAVKQMSIAVGSMAKGIKEFSDLKIPTAFDASGNATDWTTIGNSDFKNAQENIGKTLTCIVNAILDVAKTHPDLFKPGIFKDSKAMNAAKVARKMGEAVGSIAKGIKEMANLKVASKYDANGKPIEWVTLGQEDFNKVSVNLGTVLTCINNALLDVAKQYPKLFDDHLFKDSPAMNAAKVARKMGEAVGSIAKGVKEFANLRIVSKYDSKGNPIEYQSLVGKDFDTAKTNIGNVITCISDGLLEVAKENPELFDDNLFMDSPAMNATKVAKKMGEAIGVIAIGIKDWADLKIATKFDSKGNAIEYKSLVDEDFETAGEKIQKVLTCIGNALVSTVKGNKELFDDGLSGDSPAMQAAKSMSYMGTTLALTATAIAAYSTGKIPVYDKDGKLLPESKWINMDINDLAAGEKSKTYKTIYTVLTCLGRSLVNIVKDPTNKEIFDTGFFGGESPAMQASKSIKMIGDTLTTVINVITKLSNMKTEDLTSKLEGIQNNIGTSLNAILNIFQLFAKKNGNVKEESVKGGWSGLINAISGGDTIKTNGSIVEYINNHIDDINKATDAIDDMKDSVSKLINTLKSISNEYETSKKELSLFAAGINSPIYKNLDTSLKMIKSLITSLVNEELLDLLDDIEDEDSDIIDGLTSIHKICKFILNSQAALGIQYNKVGKSMFNIYGFINKFTPSIKKLISSLIDKNMLDLFDELDDNYRDIFRGINQTSSIYNMLMVQMTTMQSLYEAVSQFNIEDLIPLVSQFNNCIEALHSIGKTNEESIGNGLNSMFSSFNASEVSKTIKEYSSALELILAINERSKEAGEEGYNVLRDGILKLYSATQQIENNGLFKQHADTLNKYIQTINSVELGKLSMMKGFVDAMNQLSARLGNLDKLTDAIANKLSAVLYELVNQLTKADTSINNAHQLQEKRKKLIEESVSKIENLMSQHMIVEISQQTQDNGDMTSQPQGTINGRTVDDNIGHGTEVENSTDNTKLSSPEETNVKNNKGRQQTVSNNALTKEEFDAAMRDHWVNAIAKAIKK